MRALEERYKPVEIPLDCGRPYAPPLSAADVPNSEPEMTVNLTTIIEVGGKPAALADLQGGQTAEAEYDPTTFIAFSIEVDIPETEDEGELSGTVAAVDVTLGTLTITPTGGGADVVLTVTAATEVEVNDEHATLGDVQVGMPVKAEYDTTTLVATEVKAGTEDESD